MRKYAGKATVLVTIRVKESPTPESDTPHWTANPDERSEGRRLTQRHAVDFVRDAVASWGGQAPPDYVFFPSNIEVTARAVRRRP